MLLWEEAVPDKEFSNDRVYVISFVLASGREDFTCIISWRTEPQFLARILQHTHFLGCLIFACGWHRVSLCMTCACVCLCSRYARQKPCVRGVPNSPLLFTILFPPLLQLPYILSSSSPPHLDHHYHAACLSSDVLLCSAAFSCAYYPHSLSVSP